MSSLVAAGEFGNKSYHKILVIHYMFIVETVTNRGVCTSNDIISVVAKKLGCRLKIKLRRLKEGLKCLLCFTDSSPAKNPAGTAFSAGEFRRQPALSDNTAS